MHVGGLTSAIWHVGKCIHYTLCSMGSCEMMSDVDRQSEELPGMEEAEAEAEFYASL